MPQLDYNLYFKEAVEGLIADLRISVIESRAAEGNVGFGRAVVVGSDKEVQAQLPVSSGDSLLGITALDQAVEQASADVTPGNIKAGDAYYRDGSEVNVMRRGQIWAYVRQDVFVGDPVYFIYSGTDSEIGYFRKDDGGTTAKLVNNAEFKTNALSGELAQIEINLPNS